MLANKVNNQLGIRNLLETASCSVAFISKRFFKHWPESTPTDQIFMPPKVEDRLLPDLPYTPVVYPRGVMLPLKHPKDDIDMRGPERIHNQLIYRKFGLIAIGGGALRGEHFEVIKFRVNRYMDTERFFAIWRIDPPWKPVSKKSMGKKGGGGKAKVHHYETPVKAGRILIEIGGIGQFGEIERILVNICGKMPFYTMPISQEMMDNLKEEKLQIDEKNLNPFEYRDLLRRNFSDSRRFIGPREIFWGGTYF